MMWLYKHPAAILAVAIGAIVASTVDWSAALDRVGKAVKNLIPGINRLNAASARHADAILAEHQAMKVKVRRLAELRTKQRLTNEEMVEAAGLTRDLQQAYPSLTREIDALGTAVGDTGDMLRAMNEALVDNTIMSYEQQVRELQKRLEELRQTAKDASGARQRAADLRDQRDREIVGSDPVTSLINAVAYFAEVDFRVGYEGRIRKYDQQIAEAEALATSQGDVQDEISETEQRIRQLGEAIAGLREARGGGDSDLVPELGGETPGNANEVVSDYESNMALRLRDIRTAMIEDTERRELESIRNRYADEERRMHELYGNSQEGWEALTDAQRQSINNSARLLRKSYDAEVAGVRRAAAERSRAEEAAEAQRRAAERRDIQRQIEDVQIELSGGTDLEKQLARNAAELRRAIEDSPDMADQLRKLYGLRADIIKNGDLVQSEAARIGASGTFSSNFQGMFGVSNAQERAAKAAEKNAELQQKGNDLQSRNNDQIRDLTNNLAFA
jgi:hypothetical protein